MNFKHYLFCFDNLFRFIILIGFVSNLSPLSASSSHCPLGILDSPYPWRTIRTLVSPMIYISIRVQLIYSP